MDEEPTQAQIDFAEKLAEEHDIDLSGFRLPRRTIRNS